MVLLYEHPLSPYAQKVKIAVARQGVAVARRLHDFMSGRDDAFAAANPRREVPALVDGDTRVFDSTIILEYIEDRWPTPPLLPAAPAERARVRMLEELCDTYVEPISCAAMEIRVFKRAPGALAARLPQLVEFGALKSQSPDHRLEWMVRGGGIAIVLDGMRRGHLRFSMELA